MIGAFLIGLFGSLHCVGMCGPLMIAFTGNQRARPVTSFILYHLARISIYALIGVLFGALSYSLSLFQFQKWVMILMGVMIIIIYGFPSLRHKAEGFYYHSAFYNKIKKSLTRFYNSRWKWFFAGALNGLLPCGIIYLAAAGAILAGGFLESVFFMIMFGLGTLPALGLLTIFRHRFRSTSFILNLTTPIALISGVIIITRATIADYPKLNQLLQMHIDDVMSMCGI